MFEVITMGLSIVATDVGAIGELIENNGYLVPLADATTLRWHLSELVEQPERGESMALISRKSLKKLDLD